MVIARRSALLGLGLAAALAAPAGPAPPPPHGPLPDVEVQDQDGNTLRFASDLIQSKTVVVSFVYTSCRVFCPLMGEAFGKLQDALGDRLGRDVFLLSITTDPETDTPDRLKAWSARYRRRPGWTLVTGDTATVEQVLTAMAGAPVRRGDHAAAVLIVNLEQGVWRRELGYAGPEKYLEILSRLSSPRSPCHNQ